MIDKTGRIFEEISCNICGSRNYDIIFKDEYGRKKLDDKEIIDKFKPSGNEELLDQVVRCRKCGLIYINPRIRKEFIIKGYSEGTNERYVSQKEGREKTFAKSIRLINKHSNQKKGMILDIGAAGGSFLYVAKNDGWDVRGVEPNRWLCKWGNENYGIDIKPSTIFDHEFPSASFDVVTLWDVIEHVPDPAKVIKECRKLLKKGGILVITYPDIGSWIAKLMGKRWVFMLSVHLFYFKRKTMSRILQKNGFEPFLFKPYFQRLTLGYILFRMNDLVFKSKEHNSFIYKISKFSAEKLHIQNAQMPYWLGQTMVMARKE